MLSKWVLKNHIKPMKRSSGGFTLIEILIVTTLTMIMSSMLVNNFSRKRFDFNRIASLVEGDIRLAQSYALDSKKWSGSFRCGYGISQVDGSTYNIYAGRDTTVSSCTPSFSFSNSANTPLVKSSIVDSNVNILVFQDIFFLPPDSKLYLSNDNTPAIAPTFITLRKTSAPDCNTAGDCKFICIYPSGRMEVYDNSNLCI